MLRKEKKIVAMAVILNNYCPLHSAVVNKEINLPHHSATYFAAHHHPFYIPPPPPREVINLHKSQVAIIFTLAFARNQAQACSGQNNMKKGNRIFHKSQNHP